MKALKLYFTAFNRYRRSRGFGVHSPFAYYFINRVIKERCPYYDYDKIIKAAEKSGDRTDTPCLLFRVTNYFQPQSILAITGNGGALYALKSVSSKSQVESVDGNSTDYYETVTRYFSTLGENKPFFFIDTTEWLSFDELCRITREVIAREGVVIISRMKRGNSLRALMKKTEEGMTRGMTFSNGTTAMIIGDRKLPRQRFALWF